MAFILLLPATFAALCWAASAADGWRDRFLRAAVAFGLTIVLITELLSAFDALRRGPMIAAWSVALLVAMARGWRTRRAAPWKGMKPPADAVLWLTLAGCAAIIVATGIGAAFSPPNSADAMAYHMPRVVYWAEQGSLRFFPTAYLTQIMLQPMAEYGMLAGYLLAGGDWFVNFGQWFAALGCMIGASAVAGLLGARLRGQAISAVFSATLPAGILAASGAKNDYVMALWAIAAVYFALRLRRRIAGLTGGSACQPGDSPGGTTTPKPATVGLCPAAPIGNRCAGYQPAPQPLLVDALFFGFAVGLALFTKATAYLFLPFPIAVALLPEAWRERRRMAPLLVAAMACALAVNLPHYYRNWDLSGSPLGFDSAQGDGLFRWRNDSFGWKQTASNMLRHGAEQLGGRSERWNHALYNFVLAAHRRIGIDIDDPSDTSRWGVYKPPRNANHEADAPNRWHLLLLTAIACVLAWRALGGRDRRRAAYALALVGGFVFFCAYLKWAPFVARYQLPLFVLGAPLAAVVEEVGWRWLRPLWIQIAVCLFLLSGARLPAIENWVRPLRGAKSVLRVPRQDQYFSDMVQWNDRADYLAALAALEGTSCETVGIDITNLQLEYPLQALLRQARPRAQFVHAGVSNVSRRFAPSAAAAPCAIACLDCQGDDARLSLYPAFPTRIPAGKFVVLLPAPTGEATKPHGDRR
jgi:4-amino-4-deoxy-L-arabinose transferase-like glycosyltransferase